MFEPNSYLKILNYLGWSIDRRQEVLDSLIAAQADPIVETEIKEILERISSVSQSLEEERGSANAGLIKVDVLEYESSAARSAGMVAVKLGLTQDLANLLGLEWSNITTCPGASMTIGIEVT